MKFIGRARIFTYFIHVDVSEVKGTNWLPVGKTNSADILCVRSIANCS